MELPDEKWSQEDRPRMMGDISPISIVVCVLILGFAMLNRYLSLY